MMNEKWPEGRNRLELLLWLIGVLLAFLLTQGVGR